MFQNILDIQEIKFAQLVVEGHSFAKAWHKSSRNPNMKSCATLASRKLKNNPAVTTAIKEGLSIKKNESIAELRRQAIADRKNMDIEKIIKADKRDEKVLELLQSEKRNKSQTQSGGTQAVKIRRPSSPRHGAFKLKTDFNPLDF